MNIQQDNSKQNARTRHIDIRLTQKEYEAIVEKAAECGLTLSNYGRRLLQNHHPNKRLSDKEVQGLNSLSDARATLSAFRMYSKVNLMRLKNDTSEMKIICVLG